LSTSWFRFLSAPPPSRFDRPPRDARIDFFRGLALIFIFVDHIPNNPFGRYTLRAIGFSDAAEVFIFLSGYSAMAVHGATAVRRNFLAATVKVWRRAWQLYLAHIFLFVVMIAHVAYLGRQSGNPMFVEEMRVVAHVGDPDLMLWEAMLLRFKPRNLDILPLYVVLMLVFPLILRGLLRSPGATVGFSLGLYLLARLSGINLPSHPEGSSWFFNPFAWQFLFTLGALCALRGGDEAPPPWREARWLPFIAGAYLAFCFAIVLAWHWPSLNARIPVWMARMLYPIDKTGLDPLRLLHFLALAFATVRIVAPDARFLGKAPARLLILCGRHSLHVFCLGVFLSFLAGFVQTEMGGRFPIQAMVVVAGIAALIGFAAYLEWYRRIAKAEEGGTSP
jgi:hypothetical protein